MDQQEELQYPEIKKKWYKKWWGIFIIIFLVLVTSLVTVFGIYVFRLAKEMQTTPQLREISAETLKIIENPNSPWIGTENPEITIVEFADFNCSLCKNSHPKIRKISLQNGDKVKYIFRNYPILTGSLELALAGKCAQEQGKFWEMHDKLFQGTLSDPEAYAKQIGLNMEQYKECVTQEKYLNAINKNISDAEYLGLNGTPTWFINGNKIEGDIPEDIFTSIINNLLEK